MGGTIPLPDAGVIAPGSLEGYIKLPQQERQQEDGE
jgi:hypothetical protein